MSDDKSIRGMVIIPMLRALVTGALVGLLGILMYALNIQVTGWRIFWAIVAGTALVSWLAVIRISEQGNSTVTLKPSKVYPTTTRVEIVATDPSGVYQHGKFADLPISLQDLANIAKRIEAGGSFSHSSLAGPGKPLSRADFENLRDLFISRNLAYWVNPAAHAQGCELTKAGEAVIRHFQGNSTATLEPIPQLQEKVTVPLLSSSAAHAHKRTRGGNGKEVLSRD